MRRGGEGGGGRGGGERRAGKLLVERENGAGGWRGAPIPHAFWERRVGEGGWGGGKVVQRKRETFST